MSSGYFGWSSLRTKVSNITAYEMKENTTKTINKANGAKWRNLLKNVVVVSAKYIEKSAGWRWKRTFYKYIHPYKTIKLPLYSIYSCI